MTPEEMKAAADRVVKGFIPQWDGESASHGSPLLHGLALKEIRAAVEQAVERERERWMPLLDAATCCIASSYAPDGLRLAPSLGDFTKLETAHRTIREAKP